MCPGDGVARVSLGRFNVKPLYIVAVICIYWVVAQFFPVLGRGLVGFLGGVVTVYLLYLLLSHTPESRKGNWESHDVEGRD